MAAAYANADHDDDYYRNKFYPYKPISRLPPDLCKDHQLQSLFLTCKVAAQNYWGTELVDYYTITSNFCCFVWKQLSCEIKVAKLCLKSNSKADNFTRMLEATTVERFKPFCENHGYVYGSFVFSASLSSYRSHVVY
ncbi:hypothetical protein BLA29_006273 [Euroglyphus maynei]|uniref:Uncharacterized protein n=1 Tax=Euroglyphus maynei TaxID=6958 RepID=A0A1Y3BIL2_EURMA|nr:hypothetical protein BLA29_006273 [Euroglyphus maynei]